MDIDERYYNLKTNFYLYKAKREMYYFAAVILYCMLLLGFVILTKEKFPNLYMNKTMKIILFVLLLLGIVGHYVMKYLFHAKFNYKKYYDGVFALYNNDEISQVIDKVRDDAMQMVNPTKEPFIRSVTFYLKNRGNL